LLSDKRQGKASAVRRNLKISTIINTAVFGGIKSKMEVISGCIESLSLA
jgi:hypothetical protein